MLKTRVVTASILLAVLLAALFGLNLWQFTLFTTVFVAFAAWEWLDLAGFSLPWQRIAGGFLALLGLVGAGIALGIPNGNLDVRVVQPVLLFGCLFWALALLWVQSYPASSLLWRSRWIRLLMGVAVIVPTWLSLIYLRSYDSGAWLVLMLVALVAFADIGGYFFGRAFGKHKLAPKVSPGKTWQGFFGGQCANLCFAFILYLIFDGLPLGQLLAVCVMASLASVLGDLFESMLKRERGIKDSSNLLPGHGGVLDRIDSVTAAAPFFALGLLLTQLSF